MLVSGLDMHSKDHLKGKAEGTKMISYTLFHQQINNHPPS